MIDQKTEEILWTLPTDEGVRPMAFETNPDGSTKRIFVQLSDFHGFVTVDFATHKVVERIKLPGRARRLNGSPKGCRARRHGLAVAPDGKTLWRTEQDEHACLLYSLPDLKLLGEVKVGHHPDWLTFTPDSKRVYVANAGSNSVSVVDVATRKEIAQIPGRTGAEAQHHRHSSLRAQIT